MRASAGAVCAVLLGGCLIVNTEEEIVEEPCPTTTPEQLADASGPLAIAGDIYFIGANMTLSRVSPAGGPVSELTTEHVRAGAIAADASGVYWTADAGIVRKPPDGPPYMLALGYLNLTVLALDDTSVVWASDAGLDSWSKLDQSLTHIDDAAAIFGLAAFGGHYYYSVHGTGTIRRAPPIQDLAPARTPGSVVADDRGVYFYDVDDPFAEYGGALRLVPPDGGTVVTTADDVSLVLDLASDDMMLYFATVYDDVYRIKQVSRFGGTITTLACGSYQSSLIHVEQLDDYVYWTDTRGLYRIRKAR